MQRACSSSARQWQSSEADSEITSMNSSIQFDAHVLWPTVRPPALVRAAEQVGVGRLVQQAARLLVLVAARAIERGVCTAERSRAAAAAAATAINAVAL
eukprot:355037-Chlamydomonas_euryale.AAC.2